MATIYKCDRCSNEFTDKESLRPIAIPRTYMGNMANGYYNKELCARCITQLEEFVKTLPTVAVR